MYTILRSILFLFDPERVHYFSMNSLRLLCRMPAAKQIIAGLFSPRSTKVLECLGLKFKNPVGLGAGFDKNARYLNELEALGFGCVEIGTVTPRAQPGNDPPRLFRLPKDNALINRMGFNNEGVDKVVEQLAAWRKKAAQQHHSGTVGLPMIIGGNIGKNKGTSNEDAWKDYEICFKAMHPYVDYFVVNVSSPNTPGLRELQEKDALRKILTNLQQINLSPGIDAQVLRKGSTDYNWTRKPILLKIAPDLTWSQIDDVIELAMEIKLDGLVATNTTIDRTALTTGKSIVEQIGAGGLSGRPVRQRSTDIISYITQKTGGSICVVASGGVFTASDAREKLAAGASLVQVWTGFVYEGPAIVKNICKGL